MAIPSQPIAGPSGKPPRRRRRVPVSLRMFIGLLGVLGIIGTCVGWRLWRRQIAFEAIGRVQGSVRVVGGGPPWMQRHLGKNYSRSLGRVEFIGLAGKATDDTLCRIASLKETKELVIGATVITDDG